MLSLKHRVLLLNSHTAVQSLTAVIVCKISVSFLSKSFRTASRSTRLHPFMDQPIEVDDQEPASKDDEPEDEGIPRTSSEPEPHFGSEESK